jgi:enoyl-CoA hydratase/carnithine racemase
MDWTTYTGQHAVVDRDDAGVLTILMHSDGGACVWGGGPHRELADLFGLVAQDRQARIVIVTGTGDDFIVLPEGGAEAIARGSVPARAWDRVMREGNRLIHSLLDVEVPMIAAVNGPAVVHSEIALLCDIVLASDTAVFADAAHFPSGLVPGDGMQVVWPALLGPNAGRYLLLTGQELTARRAHELGVVGEVLPQREVMPRARELAWRLAANNPTLLRATRQVLTRPLKRAMADDLPLGLALEAFTSLSGAEWFPDGPPAAG